MLDKGWLDEKNYACLSQKIEKIRLESGVPYLDVSVYRRHENAFRYLSGEGVTGKELYYMYSCSKPVTVTAAMQLIERGLLSLDDAVEKYLPEIKDAFIIENGERVTVGDKIKISHLFTMTAGFSYQLKNDAVEEMLKDKGESARLRDYIAPLVKSPLLFYPGARFEYSLCHDILAAVIETVSGVRFSRYVNENIFAPLKMTHSLFDNSEREEDMAPLYMASGDGKVEKSNEKKILIPNKGYESGGAGLVSTVEDYARFADALASGGVSRDGVRILKEESVKAFTREYIANLFVDSGYTCWQGEDYGYGLGMRVRTKKTDYNLPVGEFGWDGAAGAFLLVDPVNEISVVIGMHVRGWPTVFKGKYLEIVKHIYEKLL